MYIHRIFSMATKNKKCSDIFQHMIKHLRTTHNSCNMGMKDLPDMYTMSRGLQAKGMMAFISGKS